MRTIALFLLLFLANGLPAQHNQPVRLDVADGLSQGMVFDICQTPDGFLWVGTKYGLNRYDGYNFKIYAHDAFDPASLGGNAVQVTYADSKGRLWLGFDKNAVDLMLPQFPGRFFHFQFDEKAGKRSIMDIVEVPADDGAIWVVCWGGIVYKIRLPKGFSAHDAPDPAANLTPLFGQKISTPPALDLVQGFLLCSDQTLLLGDEVAGLFRVDWKNDRVEHTPLPASPGLPKGVVNLFEDAAGERYVASFTQLGRLRNGRWQGAPALFNTHFIATEADGRLWFACDQGLYLASPDELFSPAIFSKEPLFKLGSVTSVFRDAGGLIWIGTGGYGLVRYDPQPAKFKSYLRGESVYKTFADRQGQVWTKRYEGSFFKIDFAQNRLAENRFDERFVRVFDAVQDTDGNFWFWATLRFSPGDTALMKFGKFFPARGTTDLFPPPFPTDAGCLLLDRQGRLWAAGDGGALARWVPSERRFSTIATPQVEAALGKNAHSQCLYQDASGDLWLGADRGLVRFEIGKLEIEKLGGSPISNFPISQFPFSNVPISIFQTDPSDRQSLSANHVSCLLDDPNEPGRFLWVCTKGGGLNLFDKKQGTFRHFGIREGLPDLVVYGILSDATPLGRGVGEGTASLWCSTNKGLVQFDPKILGQAPAASGGGDLFKIFTAADGLPSDEFNTGSFLKLPDGRLLFGGVGGVSVFRPQDLTVNRHVPPVQIVGLKINNQPFELPAAAAGGEPPVLFLRHDQNFITLEFAALDFANPAKNRYRYQLEGADPGWMEAGIPTESGRFANYSLLPPGDYVFRVQGSNNDGTWSEKPAVLRLRIAPPWWRSAWAYLSYALLFAAALYGYVRFRLYRQRLRHELELEHREAQRLAELDGFKNRLFTNISHEFRTPLTVILGNLEIEKLEIEKQATQFPIPQFLISKISISRRNAESLLRLINQVLDLAKLEDKSLKMNYVQGDVLPYLRYVAESLHSLANAQNVMVRVESEEAKIVMDYDPERLLSIVYNLLSNAIKFTPSGGRVVLKLEIRKLEIGKLGGTTISQFPISQFLLSVSDTGVGIPPEDLPHVFDRFFQAKNQANIGGTGIGLALTKELVKAMGGEISVESEVGKGTTFCVKLPISNKAPAQEGKSTSSRRDGIFVEPAPALDSRSVGTVSGERENTVPTERESNAGAGSTNMPSLWDDAPLAADTARILLIEDNPDVVEYLAACLRDGGEPGGSPYRLEFAYNGRSGIERALEIVPDLIISDVMMPEKDGFEVCDFLKNDERTSHVPIVLLTAKADVESRLAGLRRGADAYLAKPFHPEELLVTLQNLLETRRKLQAKYREAISQFPNSPISQFPISNSPDPEDAFLEKIRRIVQENLSNASLSQEDVCRQAGMGRTNLNLKMNALTGMPITHYIRSVRLRRAKELLESSGMNVSEIAYEVGFNDPKYFSRMFAEEFGVAPGGWGRKTGN